MKKKILVICGGISKERKISLETGKEVTRELKKNKYKVITCEPDKDLLKKIDLYKPDIIFNALHGQFGEDGYIQTILETQKIPYTHSGVISSSFLFGTSVKYTTSFDPLIVNPVLFILKPKGFM